MFNLKNFALLYLAILAGAAFHGCGSDSDNGITCNSNYCGSADDYCCTYNATGYYACLSKTSSEYEDGTKICQETQSGSYSRTPGQTLGGNLEVKDGKVLKNTLKSCPDGGNGNGCTGITLPNVGNGATLTVGRELFQLPNFNFSTLDTNGDDSLSKEEFVNGLTNFFNGSANATESLLSNSTTLNANSTLSNSSILRDIGSVGRVAF